MRVPVHTVKPSQQDVQFIEYLERSDKTDPTAREWEAMTKALLRWGLKSPCSPSRPTSPGRAPPTQLPPDVSRSNIRPSEKFSVTGTKG